MIKKHLPNNNKKQRFSPAFTLLELIFVIVVMGIIGKYGAEIFRNVYQGYISSSVQNRLQAETELALQQIANRLQYRIKNSIIARTDATTFRALASQTGGGESILEWMGYDIDGWLKGSWSGLIDLDASNKTSLNSPGSVMPGGSTGAIFFVGENADVQNDFGWNGTATNQYNAAHPVTFSGNSITTSVGDFSDSGNTNVPPWPPIHVYEQYQFSTSAFALELENGNLWLYSGYQPWLGAANQYGSVTPNLLLGGTNIKVTTVKVKVFGDLIRVGICAASMNTIDGTVNTDGETGGGYSICKEKAIF